MKYFLSLIFCLNSFIMAESIEMSPEGDVTVTTKWWGDSFYQNGSQLKVTSMFPVLDAYQSSSTWAQKSKTYYIPSMILTAGGTVMTVVPLVNTILGDDFSVGMFFGGLVFSSAGIGFFRLSNYYLGKAVEGYQKESGNSDSSLNLNFGLHPNGPGVLAQLNF